MNDILAVIPGTMDEMSFPVCKGNSRLSKKWTNTTVKWSRLVTRIASTTRTSETVAEYMAMSRDEQAQIMRLFET